MSNIWLRNAQLSAATDGDRIDTVQDNAPQLPVKFGNPDLTSVAEVQAACKAWYPTKLRGQTLDNYEITPVETRDPEGQAGDIVFAPVGEFADANNQRFEPSKRNRRAP